MLSETLLDSINRWLVGTPQKPTVVFIVLLEPPTKARGNINSIPRLVMAFALASVPNRPPSSATPRCVVNVANVLQFVPRWARLQVRLGPFRFIIS